MFVGNLSTGKMFVNSCLKVFFDKLLYENVQMEM